MPSCQVTCHEICHLMGLGTCRWLQCIMQGALSLDEALLRPLEPCPICLRKLQYVVGFKLVERYRVSDRAPSPSRSSCQAADPKPWC